MKHLVASKVAAIAKHNIKMKFYKRKIKKKRNFIYQYDLCVAIYNVYCATKIEPLKQHRCRFFLLKK